MQKLEGVNNPAVVTTPTATPTDEPDAAAQPARLDDKVQKANELIKQKRAERDKKNFEVGVVVSGCVTTTPTPL